MAGCSGGSGGSSGSSGGQDSGNEANFPDSGPKESGTDAPADNNVPEVGVDATPEATLPACPTPTFAPASGTADPGNVTITDTGLPAGGFIFYTTDGTNPTQTSQVYSNPIQVSQSETIRAAAIAATCSESAVAVATYTVTPPDGGTLVAPTFSPTSQTEPNDFLVALSSNPGATICFTLDGSTPTCDAAGACTGTSDTYNAANRVSINGTVTNSSTGQVTVTAIACEATFQPSSTSSQIYTLQAAPPTLVGLSAGDQPFNAAGFTPTISSLTQASISPVNTPAIWYTVNGATPTCTTGSQTPTPTTFNTGGAATLAQRNGSLQALTCKLGYLPSPVVTYAYTFTLTSPGITGGTFFARPSVASGATAGPAVVTDAANTGSTDVLCATIDGSQPTCGAGTGAGGACGAAPTAALPVQPGNNASATTTINVIACPPTGLNKSSPSTASFTLQLAQPYAYSDATLGNGLPGWDNAGGTGPVTSFAIPSASAANYPYGDGGQWNVDQVQGTACTGENPPSGCAQSYFAANYYCWSITGAAACNCAGANKITGGAAPDSVVLPSGAGVAAGQTLSIVACQNPAPAFVWATSAVTNIVVSGAGHALAPQISAPAANPNLVQASATVTNLDANASELCVTFDGSAPACTAAGACDSANAAQYCFDSSGNIGLVSGTTCVTTPGKAATNPCPGGTCNVVTIPAGPSGSPGLIQLNGEKVQAVACNAIEQISAAASQTYNFQGGQPDFSSPSAYNTGKTGDLNTNQTVGAGTFVYLTSQSNYDVPAPSVPNPPPNPVEQIHWAVGNTANCGSAGEVDLLGVAQSGSQLSDVWDNSGQQTPSMIQIPTGATTFTVTAVTCGQSTTAQTTSAPRTVTYNVAAAQPTIATSQDPGALAEANGYCAATGCGGNGQPTCCACDVSANCGTTGYPACCCSNTNPPTCSPQAKWETGTFTVYLTSATPDSAGKNGQGAICASTTTTATCGSATACGPGSQQYTSGSTLTITASGTTVSTIGCVPGLPASGEQHAKFDLSTTPAAVFTSGSGGTCGATATIDLATTQATDAADFDLGGPTPGACICFTQDGTDPAISCPAVAQAGCPAAVVNGTTTTCFTDANAGGINNITVSGSSTIRTATCISGFDTVANSTPYSLSPYSHTITVDGNLNEWSTNEATAIQDTNAWCDNFTVPGSLGYLSYDGTNLYYGLNPNDSTYSGQCCDITSGTCTDQLCTDSPTTFVVAYIGDGQGNGATVEIPQVSPNGESFWYGCGTTFRTLPANAGFKYATLWQSDGAAAPTAYKWNGTAWVAQSIAVTVGFDSATNTTEFSVPLASVGLTAGTSTVTMLGSEIADVSTAAINNDDGTNELFRWPNGGGECGYTGYWQNSLASCLAPSQQTGNGLGGETGDGFVCDDED